MAQSLTPAEVCVVDDGSTDDTRAVIEQKFPQVQYVYQDNKGVSAARNLGVDSTTSDWIAFLDSDDIWHADKLEKQFLAAEKSPSAQLIHCDEIWIRDGRRVNPMEKHRKQGGDIFEQSLHMCAISPSAAMLRRELFESVNRFDESLPACEDYDLWLRICAQHSVHFIDEALLTKYGGHEDQLSKKYWGMDRFRVRALQKLLDSSELTDAQHKQVLAVLRDKCSVLLNGARKRNNKALIAECEHIIDTYLTSNELHN